MKPVDLLHVMGWKSERAHGRAGGNTSSPSGESFMGFGLGLETMVEDDGDNQSITLGCPVIAPQ